MTRLSPTVANGRPATATTRRLLSPTVASPFRGGDKATTATAATAATATALVDQIEPVIRHRAALRGDSQDDVDMPIVDPRQQPAAALRDLLGYFTTDLRHDTAACGPEGRP